jgi:hypothetical protein
MSSAGGVVSVCNAADTKVLGLSALFNNNHVFDSQAATFTSGGMSGCSEHIVVHRTMIINARIDFID